jgi:hypothetical protein
LPGQVDTVSRACRVGKGKGNGERKRPKVRDGDEWHLQHRARRSRGPWRGGGEVAELYLHNASTSSPAGTCGAIPSRPLRRRSWRAPVGLEGRWARDRHRHRRRLRGAPWTGPRCLLDGAAGPRAIEPLQRRSADQSRSAARGGRELAGLRAVRPPRQRPGSAGLCPDTEPELGPVRSAS